MDRAAVNWNNARLYEMHTQEVKHAYSKGSGDHARTLRDRPGPWRWLFEAHREQRMMAHVLIL